jgi:hypothetical protein
MLTIQGSERMDPRNHYTTAPSVITHDTRVTSLRRLCPCKRNQEHEQEQKERNQNCVDYELGSHKLMNGDTV